MIRSFRDPGTEDIFNARDTKRARKSCPGSLWTIARRKLELLDSAGALIDLRIPPANRLEALKGACFVWTLLGPEQVEIVDYHA